MDLLAGAAFAWCTVYVLLAIYFSVLVARRPTDAREYAIFAVVCVLFAGYAYCNGQRYHHTEPMRAAEWARRALYFAPTNAVVVLHLAANYTEMQPQRRKWLLGTAYTVLALVLLANARGLLHQLGNIRARPLALGPVHYINYSWWLRPGHAVMQGLVLVCTATSLWLFIRAYLVGKREALLACLGGFVITACAINDMLVLNDVHRSIFLSEHGFSAFAFGLSYTLLARHERVSDELVLKGAELRRRARQLRKSYEELRAAQEELVRKEQLALVGELAAVVSHEVRNPLAIIANAVAGLRRAEISADDRETLLSILEEETDRLNRLVGDLLRYARPLNVERHRLDLEGLVDRACELSRGHAGVRLELDVPWRSHALAQKPAHGPLQGEAEEKVDVVAIEMPRIELPPVFGDANMLRQVLDNLVQNACQAMDSGGVLGVRVATAVEDGEGGVAIEISDTGEGMDTQVRSRARTPFFTTRPGGTGLGLAICDRIVTAHGGVLAIKSRAGEGTVVSVFLPAHRASEAPVLRSSHPPSPAINRDTAPSSGHR